MLFQFLEFGRLYLTLSRYLIYIFLSRYQVNNKRIKFQQRKNIELIKLVYFQHVPTCSLF